MKLTKNTFADAAGQKRESSTWALRFTDHQGARRRLPGFKSRKASDDLARTIERLVNIRATGAPMDAATAQFIEALPQKHIAKLAGFGLLVGAAVAGTRPLADHVADWKAYLAESGNTAAHATLQAQRVASIFRECRFVLISDIEPARVVAYLAKRRAAGLSVVSSNHYLTAAKTFLNWLVEVKRASMNPLAHVKRLNAKVDRRRKRRALEPDEIRWLLHVTASQPVRHGMTGPERAILYRLAVESGLRASELKSLTRASFDLGGNPAVTIEAAYSKDRREDRLPLRPETAALLKDHLALKMPQTEAFGFQACPKYSKILHADMQAARQAWENAPNVPAEVKHKAGGHFLLSVDGASRTVDFHSLRHTTGSMLAAAGVHPKTAQNIMRHSTIGLTMDIYTHAYVDADTAAIAMLPTFDSPQAEAAKARKS